jgi:hypothetical protein
MPDRAGIWVEYIGIGRTRIGAAVHLRPVQGSTTFEMSNIVQDFLGRRRQ